MHILQQHLLTVMLKQLMMNLYTCYSFTMPHCVVFCFFSQGAGAVTCAWLCWRIKPPYTSRTRAPPLSDIISPTPAPSVPGPHPRWKTSDLLSVRSSTLCPDVAEPDRRSALEVLISTASVWGSNYHYHPEACRQTHTYCAYIQCRHTLSPGLLHTLDTETESMQ